MKTLLGLDKKDKVVQTLQELLDSPEESRAKTDWVCGFGRGLLTLFVIQKFYYSKDFTGYANTEAIVNLLQKELEEKELESDILNLTQEELLALYEETSSWEYEIASTMIKTKVGSIALSGLDDD